MRLSLVISTQNPKSERFNVYLPSSETKQQSLPVNTSREKAQQILELGLRRHGTEGGAEFEEREEEEEKGEEEEHGFKSFNGGGRTS